MTPVREPGLVQGAIIEDQQRIREGLRILIHGTPGYYCVGAYGTLEDALPQLARETPDVALVDTGLPGISG
jgi:DNA-binding NarL/FixJ family response regulator